MKNRILLALFACLGFIVSNAQECDGTLQNALYYKNKGDYGKAVRYYQELKRDCPNYVSEKVKSDWEYCEQQLKKAQNKPATQKPSSGYVTKQQRSTDWLNNMDLYFDETGGCLNDICRTEVTYRGDWFISVPETSKNWLHVVQYGNSLDVSCDPNHTSIDRIDTIDFVANDNQIGVQTSMIIVHQEAKGTAPKRPSRPDYTDFTDFVEQPEEDLSITVKVTFEQSKADPTFENVGKLIMRLEEDKNLGLMIEIPWCSEQKTEFHTDKYPNKLMQKRAKNITNYFVRAGIAKERILWSMNNSNTECDCAYAKISDSDGGSSK